LPNNNPLSERLAPSSAAVFIKHRGDADLQTLVPEIKNLVAHSIENLTYDKVTTALFPADPSLDRGPSASPPSLTSALRIKLSPDSVQRFWVMFSGLAIFAAACLGVAVATTVAAFRRWKHSTSTTETT